MSKNKHLKHNTNYTNIINKHKQNVRKHNNTKTQYVCITFKPNKPYVICLCSEQSCEVIWVCGVHKKNKHCPLSTKESNPSKHYCQQKNLIHLLTKESKNSTTKELIKTTKKHNNKKNVARIWTKGDADSLMYSFWSWEVRCDKLKGVNE